MDYSTLLVAPEATPTRTQELASRVEAVSGYLAIAALVMGALAVFVIMGAYSNSSDGYGEVSAEPYWLGAFVVAAQTAISWVFFSATRLFAMFVRTAR
jgi:hypothetical protein